jgi:hypothetical protein
MCTNKLSISIYLSIAIFVGEELVYVVGVVAETVLVVDLWCVEVRKVVGVEGRLSWLLEV